MRVAETAAAEPPCAKVPHSPEAGVSSDRSLLFDLIKNGHGSFARFARIYRSIETGVCTLPRNPRVSLAWARPPICRQVGGSGMDALTLVLVQFS